LRKGRSQRKTLPRRVKEHKQTTSGRRIGESWAQPSLLYLYWGRKAAKAEFPDRIKNRTKRKEREKIEADGRD